MLWTGQRSRNLRVLSSRLLGQSRAASQPSRHFATSLRAGELPTLLGTYPGLLRLRPLIVYQRTLSMIRRDEQDRGTESRGGVGRR